MGNGAVPRIPHAPAEGTKPGWELCTSPVPKAAGDVGLHCTHMGALPHLGLHPSAQPLIMVYCTMVSADVSWGRKGRRAGAAPSPLLPAVLSPPAAPPAPHKAAVGAGGPSRLIQPLSHFVTAAQLDYLML